MRSYSTGGRAPSARKGCSAAVEPAQSPAEEEFIVASPEMRHAVTLAGRIASAATHVLVRGETGTGKEGIVNLIHRSSGRAGPLVFVNCGAITHTLAGSLLFGHERGAFTGAEGAHRGVFEQAQSGTLCLDEIGEMPLEGQAALLRVLETRRFVRLGGTAEIGCDARIIASTHRDLVKMAEDGTFRRDLVYRLGGTVIRVPPLRDRPLDIPALADHFLRRAAEAWGRPVHSLSKRLLLAFARHHWIGNVRELRNAVEQGVLACEGAVLDLEHVNLENPPRAELGQGQCASFDVDAALGRARAEPGAFHVLVRRFERALLLDALSRADGCRAGAARSLDLPVRTFYRKLHEHGLDRSFGEKEASSPNQSC